MVRVYPEVVCAFFNKETKGGTKDAEKYIKNIGNLY